MEFSTKKKYNNNNTRTHLYIPLSFTHIKNELKYLKKKKNLPHNRL